LIIKAQQIVCQEKNAILEINLHEANSIGPKKNLHERSERAQDELCLRSTGILAKFSSQLDPSTEQI
jgi:hypothetical protein